MKNYDYLKHLAIFMEGYQRTAKDSVLQHISGTGFFAALIINGKKTNIILTARHFAEKMKRVIFFIRYNESDTFVTVPISQEVKWQLCEDADLAYCELKPIEERFRKITGRELYATAITEDDILTGEQSKEVNILDEVIMAGYPQGESSTHHKYPLFAKGYLSSLPKDSVEDGEGYADISAVGGFSGAPMFLNNQELMFLGVLVKGISDAPDVCSGISMYVSGYKVLELMK